MIKTSVETQWFGDLLLKRVRDIADDETEKYGNKILNDAKNSCPVESLSSINAKERSGKAQKYGSAQGALRDSGRIVKFTKMTGKGRVSGVYVKFGGQGYKSKGVDVYYGRFVMLGTPGTRFKAKTGYFGKKSSAMVRVAVMADPFLKRAYLRNRRGFAMSLKGKLKK